MFVWPGLVLQSATTDKEHLKKALRYVVHGVNAAKTVLARVDDQGEVVGEPFSLLTAEVPEKLRLCHAITYDSSQARALYGNVRLTQTSHPMMTLSRLIVGLGRAPEESQLECE